LPFLDELLVLLLLFVVLVFLRRGAELPYRGGVNATPNPTTSRAIFEYIGFILQSSLSIILGVTRHTQRALSPSLPRDGNLIQ